MLLLRMILTQSLDLSTLCVGDVSLISKKTKTFNQRTYFRLLIQTVSTSLCKLYELLFIYVTHFHINLAFNWHCLALNLALDVLMPWRVMLFTALSNP